VAGPFFFAWADAGELSFGPAHVRDDEEILSFTILHHEGDFPSLDITIINPRVGLLAPGRKVWAWLSYQKPGADVVPLFFGRLVGVPEDLDQELVKLAFVARPEDFEEQKAAVAETLKVGPYWDPIWFSPDTADDPDNVLESRPELWHIDRTSLQVSTSNILVGEDGTLSIEEDQAFYDSLRINYDQAPVRSATMTATVTWTQNAAGALPNIVPPTIQSFTGAGLEKNWPKSGHDVGGGWKVLAGSATRRGDVRTPALGWFTYATWPFSGKYSGDTFSTKMPGDAYIFISDPSPIYMWWSGTPIPRSPAPYPNAFNEILQVPLWTLSCDLQLSYSASRSRTEVLTFMLEADVQSIVTEPDGDDAIALNMKSSEIVSPIDPEGALPIGDVRRSIYFALERGQQSIEYLICVARAQLLSRARAVNVEFEISGALAVDLELSCRKSLVLVDRRLPGGEAAGKIKSYQISMDGDSGAFVGTITIGCSVGKGGRVDEVAGDPTYVADGYVTDGYQRRDNQYVMPIPGEVNYASQEGLPPNDDGVDFFRMTRQRCVRSLSWTGGVGAQQSALNGLKEIAAGGAHGLPGFNTALVAKSTDDVFTLLNTAADKFDIRMVPVSGGPFETDYDVAVSDLKIPRTIDLEAGSTA